MLHVHRDPRCKPVPDEIRAFARRLLRQRGPRKAARALGVSRTALLAVTGGADVMPGTLALLREAIRYRPEQREAE